MKDPPALDQGAHPVHVINMQPLTRPAQFNVSLKEVPDYTDVSAAGTLTRISQCTAEIVLPDEVAFTLAINTCQMNGALALDMPYDLRDRIFRWNRNHHVHVAGHQMACPNSACF